MATATSNTDFNRRAAAFAIDLYQQVIKGREAENVVLSPLSIHTALGLAFMGAAGSTKDEMADVLRISKEKSDSADRFHHVLCKYNNSTMLSIANKVYVQTGNELNPSFLEISQKSFKSEAENVNFQNGAEAAKTINTWVEGKTQNKIRDLIDPSSLDASSVMVLVNAIYFKGQWKNQFPKESTRKEDFWISETESIKVDMMHNKKQSCEYGVFDDLDATAVELPFRGEDLSMLIILPNKRSGLAELEAKLQGLDLSKLKAKMHTTDVIVSMPKFKIEFSIDLNNVLTQMGMGTMFSDQANFSELLKSPSALKVSKVVHKAFIDVNEEGAEAAAATGITIILKSARVIRTIVFSVDHPFYYAITSADDEILFTGNVRNI